MTKIILESTNIKSIIELFEQYEQGSVNQSKITTQRRSRSKYCAPSHSFYDYKCCTDFGWVYADYIDYDNSQAELHLIDKDMATIFIMSNLDKILEIHN